MSGVSSAGGNYDAAGAAAAAQAAAIAASQPADADLSTLAANGAPGTTGLALLATTTPAAARTVLDVVPRTFAAAAPGINDDVTTGQTLHAEWYDSLTNPGQYTVWICDDPADGAAVWTLAGSSSGGSTMLIGHSWERLDPVTAGAGAEFLDSDTLVKYLSSGQATPGWAIHFGDVLGPDKAGILCSSAGVYLSDIDGSAYTVGNITVAILFYLDSTIASDKAIGAFGRRSAAHGVEILLGTSGGNTLLRSFQNGTFTTIKTFTGALATGLHCVCLTVVAGSKWRWSFDGSVIAETALGVAYATPTSATLGFGYSSSPDVPLPGKAIDMAIWNSQLSDDDIVALATLPGTPTYRLPITADVGGLPTIRVEANRYNTEQPLILNTRGTTPLIVNAACRKWVP